MFRVGLNPYGLTCTLGLTRHGAPDTSVSATGLDRFLTIGAEIGARCLEFDWRWLAPEGDDGLRGVAERCEAIGATPLCSAWLRYEIGETLDDALRVTRRIGATILRLHLTPVLAGARAALGPGWPAALAHARTTLRGAAARARDLDVVLAIENHQDLGSEELVAFAGEAGGNVGIVLDTGNPFAVGEDPVAFATRVAAHVRHVHLKDYRAQFTGEGVRLIRCAIGDGCVPIEEVARVLWAGGPPALTASIELGALEARHVRLFSADWWRGYPPREAAELGVALGRLRRAALPDTMDARTPWERNAPESDVIAYEEDQLQRSVTYLRSLGWVQERPR